MAIWHRRRGRTATGAKIHLGRKKRKYELGSEPLLPRVGKERKKIVRTKGGRIKVKASAVEFANVLDTSSKAIKKVKILDVLENPANPQLVRRKIITKGTIIQTELGKAKVISRPSQHGIVNALIVEQSTS